MGLFDFRRKSHWESYADWQREVYAKTARAVIDNSVRGQPVKTSASATSFTLKMFVNPEHPDSEEMPKLQLRPAAEGSMEIIVDAERIAHFKMPQAPETVAEKFQITASETYQNLMPMPLRPAGSDLPGQVSY